MFLAKLLFIAAAVYVNVASADTPTLSLPWTTYTATTVSRYSPSAEPTLWKFQNVRFGVPPTGTMRFSKPQSPTAGGSYPEPTGFPECHGIISGERRKTQVGGFLGRPEAGVDTLVQTEDCLFLDVYVPDSVTPESKVPVIVWIYGGAYGEGSKGADNINNPMYSGTGILDVANAAQQDAIFVVGNYRLGAFGWLGGASYSKMGGLQNAGLYDQRLLLEWVRDNIHNVGGDPNLVSVWGESAGAGSILHHLVANTPEPLFNRAFLQSPAFSWKWDQTETGPLEHVFQNFSTYAHCSGNLTCLQSLPLDSGLLVTANQDTSYDVYEETLQYAYGPTVDGDLIPALPAQRLRSGNFHKLDSLAISHVDQEAKSFVPAQITDAQDLSAYVTAFMPEVSMGSARQKVLENYNLSFYDGSANLAARALIQDSSFTCNTGQLFDAYSPTNNVYMLHYDVFGGFFGDYALHGTDLLPTFWNQDFDASVFIPEVAKELGLDLSRWELEAFVFVAKETFGGSNIFERSFACMYQNYLASLATSPNGDPNALLSSQCDGYVFGNKTWPVATTTTSSATIFGTPTTASYVENAFSVNSLYFETTLDPLTPDIVCDFWTNIAMTCIGQQKCGDLSEAIGNKGGSVLREDFKSEL